MAMRIMTANNYRFSVNKNDESMINSCKDYMKKKINEQKQLIQIIDSIVPSKNKLVQEKKIIGTSKIVLLPSNSDPL